MPVDSYAFLPRSFRPLFETWTPIADTSPVWTDFGRRLADARITLLSSAGLHVRGEQEPFDLERERREPNWGDPSFRVLPHDAHALGVAHLHIDPADLEADHDVALPSRALDDLAADGWIAGPTDAHLSVMGFQGRGDDALEGWRTEAVPGIVDRLRDLRSEGVVLAPV